MKLVRACVAVLVLAAVAQGGPDLPDDLAGQATDWTSLADAAMSPGEASKWKRDKDSVTGTNAGGDWSVCDLGKAAFGDGAIRAHVKTPAPCGICVQARKVNAATLVAAGTFLLRGAAPFGWGLLGDGPRPRPSRREARGLGGRREGARRPPRPGRRGSPKSGRDAALARFEALLTELGFPPTGIDPAAK